jgi:transaldolase
MTHFLLDSGNPKEYRDIQALARDCNAEIWGATTNPTLIAKNLAGKKLTQQEAFALQKEIVMEILTIVPGAVSAEVYADATTTGEEMAKQGEEIASWHERVYVKLPTTIEGFKARTILRGKKISVNNTLVFSQQQIFAITLHEYIIRKTDPGNNPKWPQLISPFVGRVDDLGENGMQLIENGMRVKEMFGLINNQPLTWMLAASIRRVEHLKRSIELNSETITAPGKIYKEWFSKTPAQQEQIDTRAYAESLAPVSYWQAPQAIREIGTMDAFMSAVGNKELDIFHPLTDAGIEQFVRDWKSILLA